MFRFEDLNPIVRKLMIEELENDIKNGTLYISPRLNKSGQMECPNLLRRAFSSGNERTLSQELKERGLINEMEIRRKPKGGFTEVKVPVNAHQLLAEGEFNRFYIRALCRLSIEESAGALEVYRAKEVNHPRLESEDKIGRLVAADSLLNDLRTNPGVELALGLPPGPNSGLSVRLHNRSNNS